MAAGCHATVEPSSALGRRHRIPGSGHAHKGKSYTLSTARDAASSQTLIKKPVTIPTWITALHNFNLCVISAIMFLGCAWESLQVCRPWHVAGVACCRHR